MTFYKNSNPNLKYSPQQIYLTNKCVSMSFTGIEQNGEAITSSSQCYSPGGVCGIKIGDNPENVQEAREQLKHQICNADPKT
jgi:hypothetical protein